MPRRGRAAVTHGAAWAAGAGTILAIQWAVYWHLRRIYRRGHSNAALFDDLRRAA